MEVMKMVPDAPTHEMTALLADAVGHLDDAFGCLGKAEGDPTESADAAIKSQRRLEHANPPAAPSAACGRWSESARSASPWASRPSTMIQLVFTHVGPFQYRAASNCAASSGTLGAGNEGQYSDASRRRSISRVARAAGRAPDQRGRNVAMVGTR